MTVEDSGPGIAEEHRPYVFDRFYRADRSRSREQGGSGLGLSIVKWVVETHGGTVTLEESSLGGALFQIHLTDASTGSAECDNHPLPARSIRP